MTEVLELLRDAYSEMMRADQVDLVQLADLRARVQRARVSYHSTLFSEVLQPETGLSMETCMMTFVAGCDYARHVAGGKLENEAARRIFEEGCELPEFLYAPRPVCSLTASELDACFAAIFVHKRKVRWAHPGLLHLLAALQLRSSLLLCELPDRNGRRALWGCALVRLRLLVALHPTGHLPMPGTITPAAVRAYVTQVVEHWDGARLREAIAKAYMQRQLRLHEAGRTASFSGQNPPCRSRSCLDVIEESLHSIDLKQLVSQLEDDPVSLQIYELLVIKLVHNTLESDTEVNFCQSHLRLLNIRDNRPVQKSHVCLLVECAQGWTVATPAGTSPPLHIDSALCTWYEHQFPDTDPLGLRHALA